MARLSSAPVVLALLLSSSAVASAQGGGLPAGLPTTCNPEQINPVSYRLSTDAQALNVTRPRTDWWDGFDATLRTGHDALGDLNDAALTIAEQALQLDPGNQLARSQLARQLVIVGDDGERASREIASLFDHGGALRAVRRS